MPALRGLHPALVARHFALALGENVEQLAVGQVFQHRRVAVVAQLQPHLFGQVAFAAAITAVAHCAVDAVDSLAHGNRGRGWLYGVGALRFFRWNLELCGPLTRFFLFLGKTQEANQQRCDHKRGNSAHGYLRHKAKRGSPAGATNHDASHSTACRASWGRP